MQRKLLNQLATNWQSDFSMFIEAVNRVVLEIVVQMKWANPSRLFFGCPVQRAMQFEQINGIGFPWRCLNDVIGSQVRSVESHIRANILIKTKDGYGLLWKGICA